MKMDLSLTGLDGLIAALSSDTKKTKLQAVVKRNAANLHRKANRKAVFRGHYEGTKFVKPTGNLRRSIQAPSFSSGGMEAVVRATAEYAPYVEYGTRFMAAQPFMRPAFNEIRQQFLDEVRKVVTSK